MDTRLDNDAKCGMSRVEGVIVGAGALIALFGVYWDDAWHTDIGRDSALAPPHLALYGGVALAGLATLAWGLRVLATTRSMRRTLRYRPLLFAGIGATTILAAGPLDAFWHSAYGRDAVLWSPPHIITVFASTAMVSGLLAGVDDRRWKLFDEVLAGLLLGNLAVAVMEYETDVPQFSEVFYLPVAVAGGLLAAWLARRITGHRYAVTIMVVGYLAVRLAITAVLGLKGHTAPDLPIAYLGLLVMDLRWRSGARRYAAAAAAMAVLALAAATVDLASQSAAALLAPTALAGVAFAATLAIRHRGASSVHAWAALPLILAGFALSLWPVTPAAAHDPGQGEAVRDVEVAAASDGAGRITFAVEAPNDCDGLEPVRLVARRDGTTRTAPLRQPRPCRFEADVRVPGDGLWFVYAEFRVAGQAAETWLPVHADKAETRTDTRTLYRPSGGTGLTLTEAATGAVVYAIGFALLAVTMWQARLRYGARSGRAGADLPKP